MFGVSNMTRKTLLMAAGYSSRYFLIQPRYVECLKDYEHDGFSLSDSASTVLINSKFNARVKKITIVVR